MNPDFDGLVDAGEAYEHMASIHQSKPRLKEAIDLRKLMSNQPVTFEVDDKIADLNLDDDEDMAGLDVESYAASYFSERTQEELKKNPATIEALLETEFISASFADMGKKMTSIHDADLVKKQIVKSGSGVKIPEDCKVYIHYVAVCEGADEPYDSTVLRKAPAVIDLRNCDLLPGFYLAITSMEMGEVSKFIVKSSLAFGVMGCPPRISPGADIFYVIEVLQVIDGQSLQSPIFMSADERASLPFEEIYKVSEKLRTDGNGHYKDENYWYAIKKYRKGINILEDYPVVTAEDDAKRADLLHTIYANLAQTYLMLGRPAQACVACKLGLKCANGQDSVKLLYRFAKAKLELKDCDASLGLCKQALQLDPMNSEVLSLKQKAKVERNNQTVANKKMYEKMFQNAGK